LYSLLACVAPSAWGRWDVFATRYASGIRGSFGFRTGDPSNIEEFRSRMSEIMVRRTWDEVRDQLPPTKREIKVLHLTPSQEREMDFLVNALRTDDGTTVGTIARLRRVLGEAKLQYLFEVIAPWFGMPFVIWVWHQDIADGIEDDLRARGLRVYKVTGKTSMYRSKKTGEVKREAVLDAWRADPGGILVCNIAVGQVGIDLSHASRAVFAELDFTPATIAQAEMRTFSPEREMEIIYLAAQHRVDEEIVNALKAKFGTSELLGIPAADAAVEILGNAFGIEDEGDLQRLMAAVLEGDE
jgi:SNF2 family DNA or RNA helicase